MRQRKLPIFTIGHSTRSIDDFIRLLKAHEIGCVVDVRTIPRSRHNPQFNAESLPAPLEQAGIRYVHMKGLGGLRHTSKDSPNTAWRNASFRGYADYMQTPEFASSLTELIAMAKEQRVALMCAEAVPWRCHRSLIADALTIRKFPVLHIMSLTRADPHKLTPFAHVAGKTITYPANKTPIDLPQRKARPRKRVRLQPLPGRP
jgi:uncharacterized protein (DUF488 family)